MGQKCGINLPLFCPPIKKKIKSPDTNWTNDTDASSHEKATPVNRLNPLALIRKKRKNKKSVKFADSPKCESPSEIVISQSEEEEREKIFVVVESAPVSPSSDSGRDIIISQEKEISTVNLEKAEHSPKETEIEINEDVSESVSATPSATESEVIPSKADEKTPPAIIERLSDVPSEHEHEEIAEIQAENPSAEPNVPLSVPDRLSASGPIMESQGQKILEAECEEPSEGIIESIPAPSSPCQPIEDTRFEQRNPVSISDFQLTDVLGKGSYGKVFLGEAKSTGKMVAVKAMKKSKLTCSLSLSRVLTEKEILLLAKREQHPFLTGLFASFQTEHHVCFAMDYAAGGDLEKWTKNPQFDYEASIFYSASVVLGLEFLHEHNIVHRDLKLENVLLDESGYIKISDFGLCKMGMGVGDLTKSFVGTPYYVAPEIFKREPYGKEVDWWALGVMLFYMVVHKFPFNGKTVHEQSRIVQYERPTIPCTLPSDFYITIKRLLAKYPMNRLGSNGAEEVKKSHLFCNTNWDGLLNKTVMPPIMPPVNSSSNNSSSKANLVITTGESNLPIPASVNEALQDFEYYAG
ncbi:hypothetical protein XENTR_v10003051 [Xenopus tropicalis]|nr:hypothetical protein XENTR_v10003051 [Xenopus tropicalis]